jgi:hypothetical protein
MALVLPFYCLTDDVTTFLRTKNTQQRATTTTFSTRIILLGLTPAIIFFEKSHRMRSAGLFGASDGNANWTGIRVRLVLRAKKVDFLAHHVVETPYPEYGGRGRHWLSTGTKVLFSINSMPVISNHRVFISLGGRGTRSGMGVGSVGNSITSWRHRSRTGITATAGQVNDAGPSLSPFPLALGLPFRHSRDMFNPQHWTWSSGCGPITVAAL